MIWDKTSRGFTLIEVLVVVVILGIITAMAYPSYQKQIRKSRRAEAKQALSDVAARQEQYYISNKRYTTTATQLGLTASPTSINGRYNITFGGSTVVPTGDTTTSYVIIATPVTGNDQNNDTGCTDMRWSSNGTKTPAGCW